MNVKRKNAFSLIEIAIVISILGILTAYAIPQYTSWSLDAKKARAKQDLATLAEQISKYEIDQNASQAKTIVRLRTLNELKGRYMANLDKLRDPWGFEYLVLPEVGEVYTLELMGYKTLDGTLIKLNTAAGEKLPVNLPPGSAIVYKKFAEDAVSNASGNHPKIVYSRGPNGRDEKGKGDDIKHECRRFKYLHSIVENRQ